MTSPQQRIMLGIDTGGTYTDAVIFSHTDGVQAKAKSLTTKHDLAIGISGAVDAVLDVFDAPVSDIKLVSISTTLATNALVEGKGGSAGLVMIGFDEADMEKSGLRQALGGDPVIFIPGGHDVQGNERPLDIAPIDAFLDEHAGHVTGFAVAGMFAVRNASHELKVKEYLQEKTGLPVTSSHELSSKLGGPKRALTTLLNARLIPVINDLIEACQKHLETIGIKAPLMVVRGDGALVSADFALQRPIETILSGPAASLIGAKFMLGTADAIVSDIGGTTTDVAILEKGWPRIEPEGASVGGFTTMVEAVAMHTYGLGGDSTVEIDESQKTKLKLGPQRQLPISLLALDYPDEVFEALNRQAQMEYPNHLCVRFAHRTKGLQKSSDNLKSTEAKLYDRIADIPQPLDKLLKGASETGTLAKLVSKGFVQVSGFTPSDAMHVLGAQDNWNGEAAQLAATIMCRLRDRFGNAIAVSAEDFSEKVKHQLTIQSADVIWQTCMKENGIEIGPGAAGLIERALERQNGFVKIETSLDRPLVGLGASAKTYYPAIGERLSSECIIPEDSDVANAIGAVAGEVRVQKTVMVTSADGGNSFQLMMDDGPQLFTNEEEAIKAATNWLNSELLRLAGEAGAENPEIECDIQVKAPEVDNSRHFMEATITMSASGLPKIS